MPHVKDWSFVSDQKRHTQDGSMLVALMKSIGLGKKKSLAVDVGCGDGIITHDLLEKRKATHVVAFDVQEEAVRAASHNLSHAVIEGRVEVQHISAAGFFRNKKNWDRFESFVINPPFFAAGSGKANKNAKDQWARHETRLSLKVWARGARRLLRTGGQLYCVFPTERLAEALGELSRQGVEPKEIWWFKDDLRKRRFFLRAVRGARSGLIIHFDHSS